MLCDKKAAIQDVASGNTFLEVTQEVLQSLMFMHRPELEDSLASTIPADIIAVSADLNKICDLSCCFRADATTVSTALNEMKMSDFYVLFLRRTIGAVVRMSILDTKVAGSNLSINMFSP